MFRIRSTRINYDSFRSLSTIVTASKKNLPQSPLKMKFLVRLIRGAWFPDAIAQLTFSPKHRAEDVCKIVKRGGVIAKINYGAVPEELYVREVFVTKGDTRKKLTIMGRGRTGMGYIRKTHITVKLDKIDFDQRIAEATSQNQKQLWLKRKQLVESLKTV